MRACVRAFVCKCSLSHQPQSKAIREARWWAGLSVNSCALTEEACNKKLTVTKSRLTHRYTTASKHWGQQWGHDIVWFHMFAGTRVSKEWKARHPWTQTEYLHTLACLQTNTVLSVIWLKCNQTGLFYPEFKQCSLWEAQHWLWFSWACTFPHWKHKLLPAWKTTEVAAQHSNSFFLGVSHLGSCSTWAGQKSWNNKQYPSFDWNKQTCQQDCEVEIRYYRFSFSKPIITSVKTSTGIDQNWNKTNEARHESLDETVCCFLDYEWWLTRERCRFISTSINL